VYPKNETFNICKIILNFHNCIILYSLKSTLPNLKGNLDISYQVLQIHTVTDLKLHQMSVMSGRANISSTKFDTHKHRCMFIVAILF